MLGRDAVFIENAIRYVDSIPINALLLKLFPSPFRAIVARVITLGTWRFYRRCARRLERIFENRIVAWHKDSSSMQNTYADWSVNDAMKRQNPADKSPDMLSRRLMTLNFAAIHTSTMTTVNLILDLFSGPAGKACLAAITAECQALSEKYGAEWSSARIAEMVMTDSALRESMRLSGFGSKAFSRKVMARESVMLSNGVFVPHGEIICLSGYSMHHDESIYPRPYGFCYDRFLKPQHGSGDGGRETRMLIKAAATTELTYAVWGHGKHACPGRFFAVNLIKMIVAHMVQHYEVKPWDVRPANMWIGDTPVPPRSLNMEICRRQ